MCYFYTCESSSGLKLFFKHFSKYIDSQSLESCRKQIHFTLFLFANSNVSQPMGRDPGSGRGPSVENHYPIQWVPGLSRRKSGRVVPLNTHPYLAQMLKKE